MPHAWAELRRAQPLTFEQEAHEFGVTVEEDELPAEDVDDWEEY